MHQPYLSIILTSRNDDYAGGMLPRLQICIDSLLEQAEKHQLELELIVVDWNPPMDRLPLRDALKWSKAGDFSTIQVIDVPPKLHNQLPFSKKIPFLAHVARNVGVRRARGEFILVTATDILFSEELVSYLASKQLHKDKNYRIDRHNVSSKVIAMNTLIERLDYCKNNINFVYPYPKGGIFGLPHLHHNGSGDFVLLSRENFCDLHGIPEEKEYHSAYFDVVFCYMMYAKDIKEEVLVSPKKIYHMDHDSFWESPLPKKVRETKYLPESIRFAASRIVEALLGSQSNLDRLGIPYINLRRREGQTILRNLLLDILEGRRSIKYNDESWGLGDYKLAKHTIVSAVWDHKS